MTVNVTSLTFPRSSAMIAHGTAKPTWCSSRIAKLNGAGPHVTHGFVCSRFLVRSKGDVRYFVLIIHEEYGGIA
jgi:hypothetical protein